MTGPGGEYVEELPTDQRLVAAYLDAAHTDADQPLVQVPVLLSHLVTWAIGVALLGVNAAVWDLVPGGLAAVLSVVALLVQTGITALAARWAHDRSRPFRGNAGGNHAV